MLPRQKLPRQWAQRDLYNVCRKVEGKMFMNLTSKEKNSTGVRLQMKVVRRVDLILLEMRDQKSTVLQ